MTAGQLQRFSVELSDGRLFHFKCENDANLFAVKHQGHRIPFNMELLPDILRNAIAKATGK